MEAKLWPYSHNGDNAGANLTKRNRLSPFDAGLYEDKYSFLHFRIKLPV